MKTNLTPDRKRISADEYEAILALESAYAVLESAKVRPVLADRLKGVKYGMRDMGTVVGALGRIMKGMYDTVPYEQLKHLSNNVKHSAIRVGVFINARSKTTGDTGMLLSWDQINVLNEAAREKCLVCSLDPQQQKSCPLAKIYDQMPGDKDKYDKGCGYSGL
jgi:hypothetical protein